MRLREERTATLKRIFNLTEYQAKSLEFLINVHPIWVTAKDITDSTAVPRQRVYGELRILAKEGMISFTKERPARFRAAPMRNFETMLQTHQEDDATELHKVLSEVCLR